MARRMADAPACASRRLRCGRPSASGVRTCSVMQTQRPRALFATSDPTRSRAWARSHPKLRSKAVWFLSAACLPAIAWTAPGVCGSRLPRPAVTPAHWLLDQCCLPKLEDSRLIAMRCCHATPLEHLCSCCTALVWCSAFSARMGRTNAAAAMSMQRVRAAHNKEPARMLVVGMFPVRLLASNVRRRVGAL